MRACEELGTAVDLLSVGVIVIEPAGRIRFANAMARELLRRGDGVRVRDGMLQLTDVLKDRQLWEWLSLCRNCTRPARRMQRRWSLVLYRCATPLPLQAIVQVETVAVVCGERQELRWTASMVLADGARGEGVSRAREISEIFGLTAREAQLAWQLYEGRTLGEAAVELGIGLNTAKTHLGRVFAKAGVKRQQELMLLIDRCLAPVLSNGGGSPWAVAS